MDIEGIVLILKLWVGDIEQPFHVLMREYTIGQCVVMALRLSEDVEKELDLRVRTWECGYQRTAIT